MTSPVERIEIESSRVATPSPELNAPGKTGAVRAMFAEIAPSYDRLNHLLSVNFDRLWRRFTVKKLKGALSRPDALALARVTAGGEPLAPIGLAILEHAHVR